MIPATECGVQCLLYAVLASMYGDNGNVKKQIAQILVDEGYIKNFRVIEDNKQGVIRIT